MDFVGGPGGIRTHDLSDANRTLSQLSYRPKCKRIIYLFSRNVNNKKDKKTAIKIKSCVYILLVI